jgi:hypothetical protein
MFRYGKGSRMPIPFADVLRAWQNFYFMAGGASATLMGLLFVAVSLGSHLISVDTQAEIATFVTPILFYFMSVLVIACVMLVPTDSVSLIAAALLVIGAVGLRRVLTVVRSMKQLAPQQPIDHSHWLWHASIPGASYTLIVGAAGWLLADGTADTLLGVALAIVLLLFSGLWRTWDLVLWIAHQRRPDRS